MKVLLVCLAFVSVVLFAIASEYSHDQLVRPIPTAEAAGIVGYSAAVQIGVPNMKCASTAHTCGYSMECPNGDGQECTICPFQSTQRNRCVSGIESDVCFANESLVSCPRQKLGVCSIEQDEEVQTVSCVGAVPNGVCTTTKHEC